MHIKVHGSGGTDNHVIGVLLSIIVNGFSPENLVVNVVLTDFNVVEKTGEVSVLHEEISVIGIVHIGNASGLPVNGAPER